MSKGFPFAEWSSLASEDLIAVREVIPIKVNQKEDINDIKVARRRNKVTADGKKKTGYPKRTIRCGMTWNGGPWIMMERRGSTRGGRGGWAESMTGIDGAAEAAQDDTEV